MSKDALLFQYQFERGTSFCVSVCRWCKTSIHIRWTKMRNPQKCHMKLNELKDRGYNVDVGVVVMNETDQTGKKIRKQLEIDFVCNKGSKRYYIQSAFAMHDEKKMQQEQRSPVNTGDGFKKIKITKDAIAPLYNEEGVLVMSVFDFLLNPDSMDL